MNRFLASALVGILYSALFTGLLYIAFRITHTTQIPVNALIFGCAAYFFVDGFRDAYKDM